MADPDLGFWPDFYRNPKDFSHFTIELSK